MPALKVAYFSMEIMLETDIPTYAGGLGVLAGDILRSCADLHIPACGVSKVWGSLVSWSRRAHSECSKRWEPSGSVIWGEILA